MPAAARLGRARAQKTGIATRRGKYARARSLRGPRLLRPARTQPSPDPGLGAPTNSACPLRIPHWPPPAPPSRLFLPQPLWTNDTTTSGRVTANHLFVMAFPATLIISNIPSTLRKSKGTNSEDGCTRCRHWLTGRRVLNANECGEEGAKTMMAPLSKPDANLIELALGQDKLMMQLLSVLHVAQHTDHRPCEFSV